MLKGRGILAVPPLLPPQMRRAAFTDFTFISYPMITGEAGFPLTQKPSHRAQPPKLSPGTRVKDFVVFKDTSY